ncbi:MAG TPA: hypothetical protein VHC22_17945 [Pirellulales bacterium]|nr:hypothetical protein [Pirellulales bacterium]
MTSADLPASHDVRCKEVVQMWLRWNDASQQMTERLFEHREDPQRLQEMLDDLDRLRLEAVSASRQLLGS